MLYFTANASLLNVQDNNYVALMRHFCVIFCYTIFLIRVRNYKITQQRLFL